MSLSDILYILLAVLSIVYQVYGDVIPRGEEYLHRCLSGKHHKKEPSSEGAIMKAHCKMHQSKSCCTWNTTEQIHQDGVLSLYNIVWDQCPHIKNMSDACKAHFQKDTCFYECSPNLGPWIQPVTNSKTRKERIMNVPLCASQCIDWYHDCMFDYTCNDNWGLNWNWKKKGTIDMCPKSKSCKTIKEYFPDPQVFCEKIFNYSFKYETDESNHKCMSFSNVEENAIVAEVAAHKRFIEEHNHADACFISMIVLIFCSFVHQMHSVLF